MHGEEEALPELTIHPRGVDALRRHIRSFPPSEMELMESYETGSSLVHIHNENNAGGKDDALAQRLGELALRAATNTADIAQNQAQRVDLKRRRQYHANTQRKKQGLKFREILGRRSKLPAYAHQMHVVQTVAQNFVTIISGETGTALSTPPLQAQLGCISMADPHVA